MDYKVHPRVVESFPADNAEGISIETSSITVKFSEALDRNHIGGNAYLETDDGLRPPIKVSCTDKVITLTIEGDGPRLRSDTTYRIVLRGDENIDDGFVIGLRNVFGRPLQGTQAIYFKTGSIEVPLIPMAISPVHIAILKEVPEFKWSDVGAERYEVECSTLPTFDKVHWGNQHATNPVRPSLTMEFPDGTYYWRVRGIGTDESKGEWSSVYIFIIDTEELSPVTPEDTLPPEIGYEPFISDSGDYVEYLDVFPADGLSSVNTNLKTVTFRVLGEVSAEDVEFNLYGESVLGDEEDHGDIACDIKAVYDPSGFTTIYVTIPVET